MSKELLLVAEALSNEKGVSKAVVLEAIQRLWSRQRVSYLALIWAFVWHLIRAPATMKPFNTGMWLKTN